MQVWLLYKAACNYFIIFLVYGNGLENQSLQAIDDIETAKIWYRRRVLAI